MVRLAAAAARTKPGQLMGRRALSPDAILLLLSCWHSSQTVTDKEVSELVQRFDVNGDGELDLQEWLELAAIMFLGKGGRELTNETFNVRPPAMTRAANRPPLRQVCVGVGAGLLRLPP